MTFFIGGQVKVMRYLIIENLTKKVHKYIQLHTYMRSKVISE